MTKHEFGDLLKSKIEMGLSVVELSRWAFGIFNENCRGLEPDLKGILLDIARMEDAPEFEYSTEELRGLVDTLIASPD